MLLAGINGQQGSERIWGSGDSLSLVGLMPRGLGPARDVARRVQCILVPMKGSPRLMDGLSATVRTPYRYDWYFACPRLASRGVGRLCDVTGVESPLRTRSGEIKMGSLIYQSPLSPCWDG